MKKTFQENADSKLAWIELIEFQFQFYSANTYMMKWNVLLESHIRNGTLYIPLSLLILFCLVFLQCFGRSIFTIAYLNTLNGKWLVVLWKQ